VTLTLWTLTCNGRQAYFDRSPPPTSSSLLPSPTTSTTTSSTSPAVLLDAAGCPIANGTIYNFSGSTFIILCYTDLNPFPGDNNVYDVADSIQSTLDACIDACISWDDTSTNKCVAVSWQIYNPSALTNNYRCWYKNSTTLERSLTFPGDQIASALLVES
jgi:hypothetical protein